MDKKITPSILPGFMELLPADQILFNKMLRAIQSGYERFGFIPLDTPVIEKSEVLLAKAGGETEQQIYRFTKGDNDLALRFDLTVPLARYVSQYYPNLKFPFRRYQIGKVYRGERPQKGRFREFYQCDVDIIGDGELSLIYDAEIPAIIAEVFPELGFDRFVVRINNRKLLNGFFQSVVKADQVVEVLRIVDKLEKIGEEGVTAELLEIGIKLPEIKRILTFIAITGTPEEIFKQLRGLSVSNETFELGVNELEQVVGFVRSFGVKEANFCVDLTVARGLGYYTGTVYETRLTDYPGLGSVCSGGRYDNLTGYYSDRKMPGVGISIGLTRLFYQLREAGIIKSAAAVTSRAIVIPLSEKEIDYAITVSAGLRAAGINTEVYLTEAKVKKKFSYASDLGIPFAVVVGDNEKNSNLVTLKNLGSAIQAEMSLIEAIKQING